METSKPKNKHLTADLLAGLTFALVNIPQSLAHAMLAAVNPVFGLYTLMLATPVGALFTSSVFMNVSTTSALAVAAGDTLTTYPSSDRGTVLVTLVLLIGVFQIILGVLRLGWVTRFIPFSVMTGFMTGVAVLIIIGQLGDFTGYYSSYSGKIAQLADLVLNTESIKWATLVIGLLTIALIYWLGSTRLSKFSLILSLLLASGIAILLNEVFATDIKLVGDIADIPSALPQPVLPDLSLISKLIVPAISIGIIGIVQGAGVSQTFPNPDGKFSNVSRDFLGQGAANLAGGFFGGIPAGGSSSGTALIISAGARSRWANIFGGIAGCHRGFVVCQSGRTGRHAGPCRAGHRSRYSNGQCKSHPDSMADEHGCPHHYGDHLWLHAGHAASVCCAPRCCDLNLAVRIPAVKYNKGCRVGDPSRMGGPLNGLRRNNWNQARRLSCMYTAIFSTLQLRRWRTTCLTLKAPFRAVVILLLRGNEDVGSTVNEVFRRYAEALQSHSGKLILAGVSPALRDQLQRTGLINIIGPENIFPATETIGEAGNAALKAATDWLAESSTEQDASG